MPYCTLKTFLFSLNRSWNSSLSPIIMFIIGLSLLSIATTIVLSLIPLYLPTHTINSVIQRDKGQCTVKIWIVRFIIFDCFYFFKSLVEQTLPMNKSKFSLHVGMLVLKRSGTYLNKCCSHLNNCVNDRLI
jgi:hypothetical protein